MEGNHYMRAIECYICGCLVFTTANRSMCEDCKEERRIERQRLRYKCKKNILNRGSLMVIYDPDCEYGYHAGAIFDGESVKAMLCPTVSAFTPGTQLKNCRGELFMVKRRKNGGEELVRCDVIINQAMV